MGRCVAAVGVLSATTHRIRAHVAAIDGRYERVHRDCARPRAHAFLRGGLDGRGHMTFGFLIALRAPAPSIARQLMTRAAIKMRNASGLSNQSRVPGATT